MKYKLRARDLRHKEPVNSSIKETETEIMRLTPFAVVALVLAVACSGNKDNAANQPATTTDTSAGAMTPSTTPPASPSTPAASTPATPDTTQMAAPAPDTSMKKMSGKKHKKSADTTMH